MLKAATGNFRQGRTIVMIRKFLTYGYVKTYNKYILKGTNEYQTKFIVSKFNKIIVGFCQETKLIQVNKVHRKNVLLQLL